VFDLNAWCAKGSISLALLIVLLLKHNRVDIAQRQLEALKSVAEDAALTQLCEAWVNMRLVKFSHEVSIYYPSNAELTASWKNLYT
jgi:hypothetical protein